MEKKRECSWRVRKLLLVKVLITVFLTSELVQSTWSTPQSSSHSAHLSSHHDLDLEEEEDDGLGNEDHDIGTFVSSPISDSFPVSGFGSSFVHNSGLDTISIVDHHLHQPSLQGACEPIRIGMCMDLGYNETRMPNLVGHDAQDDADALLRTFTPLIQYNCSVHLKLLLCSSHAPMCTDKTPEPIGPCRSLCESVRRKCERVLTEFGFQWPPSLDCNKFHPENNYQHMCIPGPKEYTFGDSSTAGRFGSQSIPLWSIPAKNDDPAVRKVAAEIPPSVKVPSTGTAIPEEAVDVSHFGGSAACKGPGRAWVKGHCWKKCPTGDESSKNSAEMEFIRNYTLPWAILSFFLATLALILGFRSSKLNIAERPILYIAFCQMMFALGTIIGTSMSLSCVSDKTSGLELLAGKGSVPSPCALTFILTYFFGLATNLWWLVLCLCWMLSLSMNLRISIQQKERSWGHLVSWATPSVLSATALIYKKVEAHDLSGLCGIGFQDSEALMGFVLIPLGITLLLGSVALLCGGITRICPNWIPKICCFRKTKQVNAEGSARQNHAYSPVLVLPPPNASTQFHHHRPHAHLHPLQDHEDTSPSFFNSQAVNRFQRRRVLADDNGKASWMRIGIFVFVHILPLASQVGGIAYEFESKNSWEHGHGRPNLEILLLRLYMSLIPGFTAGVWVLSTISWKSVREACSTRLEFCNRNKEDTKVVPSLPSPSSANSSSHHASVTGPAAAPLLIPVPLNSLATTYVTLGGRTDVIGQGHHPHSQTSSKQYAGIVRPRYHQPPLPPLPARNPEPLMLEAWRRTETIVNYIQASTMEGVHARTPETLGP